MSLSRELKASNAVWECVGAAPGNRATFEAALAAAHLSYAASLFPGCASLTVSQVAICLWLSAGHIHNLHSMGRLPFMMTKYLSYRPRASVHDLASYMHAQEAQLIQGSRPPRGCWLRLLQVPARQAAARKIEVAKGPR